jgi:hypothetical protein
MKTAVQFKYFEKRQMIPTISSGTQFIGKIDKINNESIQTKFIVLGMPLFPIGSFYCLEDPFPGSRLIRIQLNRKSVILAYLRWWISIPSITLIIIGWALEQYTYLFGGALGIAIFLVTLLFGRLSSDEKERRKILINVVGLGADPKILPQEMRQSILAKLEEKWGQTNVISLHENWKSVSSLSSMEIHLYPLIYCLALYAEEAELAERFWKNLKQINGQTSNY